MKQTIRRLTQKPERLFFVVCSFFGVIAALLMPALTGPDEGVHFWMSYGMFSDGQQIPNDLLISPENIVQKVSNGTYFEEIFVKKVNLNSNEIDLTHNKTVLLNAENDSRTVSSVDITHLPQAIGILIGRLAYPSVGVMTTLGRLANLAVYIFAIYYIIRGVRYGKFAFVFLALFPMLIQQAGSLSYDVVNIVTIFGWFALMINLSTQTSAISRRQLLLVVLLAIGLMLTKTSNILLLGILPFLPTHLYSSYKPYSYLRRLLHLKISQTQKMIFMYLSMALLVIGSLLILDKFLEFNGIGFRNFIGVFLNTFFRPEVNPQLDPIITTGLVGNFGWLWYRLPEWLVFVHLLVFVMVLLGDKVPVVSKRFAIASTGVFIASAIGITLAMYFLWTLSPGVAGAGATYIQGMQGRYFTPLLIFLVPGFAYIQRYLRVTIDQKTLILLVCGMAIISLIVYLILTYIFFYTPADGVKDILLS